MLKVKYLPLVQHYLKKDKTEIQVFEIFRAWIKHANLPDNFVIHNEEVILKDFDDSLEKAFVSLFNGDRMVSISTYYQIVGIGFVEGFVSANLGVKWTYAYKLPYDEAYLSCKSIREIIRVLEFEEIKALKFNQAMLDLMIKNHPNFNFDFHTFDYLQDTKKHYDAKFLELISDYPTINVPDQIISQELGKINFYNVFKEYVH